MGLWWLLYTVCSTENNYTSEDANSFVSVSEISLRVMFSSHEESFMCSFAWLNRFTYWTVFCKMCYAAKFTAWMLSLVIFCNEIWAHCGDLSSQTFCSYQHRSILLCLSITPAVIYLTSDDFSITMSDDLPTFQKWLQSIEKLLQWVSNCINP